MPRFLLDRMCYTIPDFISLIYKRMICKQTRTCISVAVAFSLSSFEQLAYSYPVVVATDRIPHNDLKCNYCTSQASNQGYNQGHHHLARTSPQGGGERLTGRPSTWDQLFPNRLFPIELGTQTDLSLEDQKVTLTGLYPSIIHAQLNLQLEISRSVQLVG